MPSNFFSFTSDLPFNNYDFTHSCLSPPAESGSHHVHSSQCAKNRWEKENCHLGF